MPIKCRLGLREIIVMAAALTFSNVSVSQTADLSEDLRLEVQDALEKTSGYVPVIMLGTAKKEGWMTLDQSRKKENVNRLVLILDNFVCFMSKVGSSSDMNFNCLNGDVFTGKRTKIGDGHLRLKGSFKNAGPAKMIIQGYKPGNLSSFKKELNAFYFEQLTNLLNPNVAADPETPSSVLPSTSPPSKLDKAKSVCTELGFTLGTEKYGDCVLKMMDN